MHSIYIHSVYRFIDKKLNELNFMKNRVVFNDFGPSNTNRVTSATLMVWHFRLDVQKNSEEFRSLLKPLTLIDGILLIRKELNGQE